MTNNLNENLKRGRELLEKIAPETEKALKERYDHILPELSKSVVEISYGHTYSRTGLDIKTSFLLTIPALTAQESYSAPQLEIHNKNTLNAGVGQREICKAIFQMSLYGGFLAKINALNTALSVFSEIEEQKRL